MKLKTRLYSKLRLTTYTMWSKIWRHQQGHHNITTIFHELILRINKLINGNNTYSSFRKAGDAYAWKYYLK